jgi:hypothetical protein
MARQKFLTVFFVVPLLACDPAAMRNPANITLAEKEALQDEYYRSDRKVSEELIGCIRETTKKVAGDQYELFMTYASIGFLAKLNKITSEEKVDLKNRMIDENRDILQKYNDIGREVSEICINQYFPEREY